MFTEGAAAQFELLGYLVSDCSRIGVICSSDDKDAKIQIEEYEELAKTYGMEIIMEEIEQEADIDIAASRLAGSVDCIFCLDDSVVNGLIQTVCAYADEVGIPVIGRNEGHVQQGCVAAYEKGTLYWNAQEASKLGLNTEISESSNVKECE